MAMSDLQIQRAWKYFIWIYFLLATIFFVLLDAQNLPDYAAYAGIYRNPENINEPLFVILNNFFRNSGLSYEYFRKLGLLFSLGSLLYLIVMLQKLASFPKNIGLNFICATLLFYVLSIFIFEFYIIRVRAGLAIALFCIGVSSIAKAPKSLAHWAILLSAVGAAFFIHKASAVILTLVFGVTALPILKSMEPRLKEVWILNFKSILIFYVTIGGTLLFLVSTQNQVRTGVVISPLNIFRLICLSVAPIFIFFGTKFLGKKNIMPDSNQITWYISFEFFYIVLAIELLILYSVGLTSNSGEAIVRFFTLLSFTALVGLISSGSIFSAPLCSYLLIINSSFFLATLNMFPVPVLRFLRVLGKS